MKAKRHLCALFIVLVIDLLNFEENFGRQGGAEWTALLHCRHYCLCPLWLPISLLPTPSVVFPMLMVLEKNTTRDRGQNVYFQMVTDVLARRLGTRACGQKLAYFLQNPSGSGQHWIYHYVSDHQNQREA